MYDFQTRICPRCFDGHSEGQPCLPISQCLGCGCDEQHACQHPDHLGGPSGEPCAWVWVNPLLGVGICSLCRDRVIWGDGESEPPLMRRIFPVEQLDNAIAFSEAGGQALHLTRLVRSPTKEIRKALKNKEPVGQIFDFSMERLIKTLDLIGGNVLSAQTRGKVSATAVITGEVLDKAKRLFVVKTQFIPFK
jgi:hypothetical protein